MPIVTKGKVRKFDLPLCGPPLYNIWSKSRTLLSWKLEYCNISAVIYKFVFKTVAQVRSGHITPYDLSRHNNTSLPRSSTRRKQTLVSQLNTRMDQGEHFALGMFKSLVCWNELLFPGYKCEKLNLWFSKAHPEYGIKVDVF